MSYPRDNRDVAIAIASDHALFTPFAYNLLKGSNDYISTPFDGIIDRTLNKTFTGEIKRLIINIPPRHSKTLKAVQVYIARGFAINNKSCFVHASYSDKLVSDNSAAVKDIVSHPDYQLLFPHVKIKQDTKAKGLWKTSAGGTLLASPSGGSITGFGAGIIGAESFAGALIIDDPLKPDDAMSETKRGFINQRWENTFKSRLADPNTPVIVIMQRVHDEDFTYELLEGSGADEDWHHLVLPAYIDPEYEYKQSGRYIEHDLPEGPLWPLKFTKEKALSAMDNIQWSQEPIPAKGEVYERQWFKRYKKLPANIKDWAIYCDTASKTNKYNDYSVFQLWAKTTSNHGYLVKQWREKVKIPFLVGNFEKFYKEAEEISGKNRIKIGIEDKDSGVGLIQSLELLADSRGVKYKVKAIQRKEGKYARAVKAAPHIKNGEIFIPEGKEGDVLITECTKFKADDSHKHDDQIDPMNDFINFELPKGGFDYGNA